MGLVGSLDLRGLFAGCLFYLIDALGWLRCCDGCFAVVVRRWWCLNLVVVFAVVCGFGGRLLPC